jgi:hypothetical protein
LKNGNWINAAKTSFKSGFKGFNRITNTQAKLDMLAELFSALVSDLETYNQQASLLICS